MAAAAPNRNGEEEPPVRRSMVRRKSKGSETSSSKKKKVAQRGMGVEKLERQRIQQEWNKMNLHHPSNSPSPTVDHLTQINYSLGFNSYLHFGINNAFFNHSSTTPNSSLDCNSQRCNACHKKKKVTNRNLGSEFVGMMNQTKEENEETKMAVQVEYKGGGGGGGGGRVMEYEFFPLSSSSYIKDEDDEQLMMKKKNMMMITNCNCVDLSLSLKL